MSKLTESTETRFVRAMTKLIESELRLDYTNEIDFNSPTLSIPKRYSRPVFAIKMQELPETRGLPVKRLRANINIGINRTAGNYPGEQDKKVLNARNALHNIMRTRRASSLFNTRKMELINSDTSTPQDSIISLTQFEFTAFQTQQEY